MADVIYPIPKHTRPVWEPEGNASGAVAAPMVEIPLLGNIAAGRPLDLYEQRERVLVPSDMVRKNTYALRVRGRSMVDDAIRDGDIVIIEKRETADNGESVVAMINGESVTLKKFYVERRGIRLQPANPDMTPIWLRNEEVQILGIVTGVIRGPD